MNFTFNGVKKPYLTVTNKKRLPWAPIRRRLLTLQGMPGAYLEGTDVEPLPLAVEVFLESAGYENLERLKEDMAGWLVTDSVAELIFDDDPIRTYYAAVDGSIENIEEIVKVGKGTITFICPDPYKYGPVVPMNFSDVSAPIVLNNGGKVPTPPLFNITLKGPTTFLDIIGDEDYMRIGQPVTVDETAFVKYEPVWSAKGTTTTGWASAGYVPDGGTKSGSIGVSNGNFIAADYGTGSTWHGPAVAQSIGSVENDFLLRVYIDVKSTNNQRPRNEIYLLDEAGAIIGKLSVVVRRSTGEVDIEINIRNGANNHFLVSEKWKYRDFFGYLDIIREGSEITASAAQQSSDRTSTLYKRTFKYDDINNEFQKTFAAVGMHFGSYGTYPTPTQARISRIDVQRVNDEPQGVPYIGDAGDVFTLDHKTSKILKNGDPFTKKDFGARFFDLKKGDNALVFNPSNVIQSVDVEWRTRYR